MGVQTLTVKDSAGVDRLLATMEALVCGAGGLANPDAGTLANLLRSMLIAPADILNAAAVAQSGPGTISLLGVAAAGHKHIITGLVITNTSATDTKVTLQKGSTFLCSVFVKANSTAGFAGLSDGFVAANGDGAVTALLSNGAATVDIALTGNVVAA